MGMPHGRFSFLIKFFYCGFDAEPNEWSAIVQKVMHIDSSWNNTAGKYIDLYNSIRVRE